MSETIDLTEAAGDKPEVNKNKRYRRDKPWDNDPTIDKFAIDKFTPEDNPNGGVFDESSFSVLFPQYRELYIKEVWPLVKKALKPMKIDAILDTVQGCMSVHTTRQTWDPYSIIRARDLIKMLARSVPYQQAIKLMTDDKMFCEVIKIGNIVRSRDKFIKRRQRLVGPKGMTLKALELLSNCYILVQGNTVSAMGEFKDLKHVHRIIVDCMQNVHPIYAIKELMIKKELSKNPEMQKEDWSRFMPQFKKQNVNKRKKLSESDKAANGRRKKREYTPFPPEQLPRKEDIAMATGEHFLTEKQKENIQKEKKRDQKEERKQQKAESRNKDLDAPEEGSKSKDKYENKKPSNIDDLKKKFLKK